MELLANGTSLLSGECDVGKSVITLISTAETMADELMLYRLDSLDDVVRAGICHMLRSLLRGGSINEKLALATIAGVGAEDGIGSHWSWGGETRASLEQQYSKAPPFPGAVTKLYKAQACSISVTQ